LGVSSSHTKHFPAPELLPSPTQCLDTSQHAEYFVQKHSYCITVQCSNKIEDSLHIPTKSLRGRLGRSRLRSCRVRNKCVTPLLHEEASCIQTHEELVLRAHVVAVRSYSARVVHTSSSHQARLLRPAGLNVGLAHR